MSSRRRRSLYSPELLALAVELAGYPFDQNGPGHGYARSRTCGSEIAISTSAPGQLSDVGMQVSACAVGQAAAAIFVREASGKVLAQIELALRQIDDWLRGNDPMPDWSRLEMLSPALAHSGRHEAILLPWRAALDVLSKDDTGR